MRRYTLVLVGYSADDPPMRYMLEATEEGRLNFPDLKPAYALVADDKNDAGGLRELWRGTGLPPLLFVVRDYGFSLHYHPRAGWADNVHEPLARSETKNTESNIRRGERRGRRRPYWEKTGERET